MKLIECFSWTCNTRDQVCGINILNAWLFCMQKVHVLMPNYPRAKAWRGLAAYYYKDCEDISLWKMAKHTGLRAWLQGVGHTASTSSFPHFNYGWLEARRCHRPQIKLKYDKAEISGPGLLHAPSHVRLRYYARNYNICQYFFDRFNMDMSERGVTEGMRSVHDTW